MSRSFHRAGATVLTVLAINGCSDASAPVAPTVPVTPPMTSVAPASITYSGEAWAAQVRVPPLGINQRVSQAGPLSPAGGKDAAAVLAFTVPAFLQLEVLAASTSGAGGVAQAQAKINRTRITVPGVVILIEVLQAYTKATCQAGNPVVKGSTVITSLTINNQKIAVSGAPNQTVPFLGGTLTINEQIPTTNSISVNGVHVKVTGLLNVILSHAKSDIHC